MCRQPMVPLQRALVDEAPPQELTNASIIQRFTNLLERNQLRVESEHVSENLTDKQFEQFQN